MPSVQKAVRWSDLLDEFKTAPRELFGILDRSSSARNAIKNSIENVLPDIPDWPTEVRDWRPILLALLRMAIGGIADPWHQKGFDDQILAKADEWGTSPGLVRLAGSRAFSLYERLKDVALHGVAELRSCAGDNE